MKKKLTKTLAVILAMICLVSTFVIYSSAANFNEFDWQYTAITNTSGKSSATYSGYYNNSANDYFFFYAYCQGGPVQNFRTTLEMRIVGGSRIEEKRDSTATGSNFLEASISRKVSEYPYTANGYTEQHCTSKTNTSDAWHANYLRVWVGGTTGWREY